MSAILGYGYYPLWVAHPLMQVGLALLIWRRKLLRTYPMFFAYVVFEVMLFAVLFVDHKDYVTYFYLYWLGTAISALFGFVVIHEVFTDVLRPFHALRDFSSMLFRWAGLVVMLIAITAAMSSTKSGIPLITAGPLSLERSVRVMQCGLVLFLLMFSRYLGISRRHRSFGVALGFGFFAVAEFALLGLQVAGIIHSTTLNVLNMGAYDVAILTWLIYIAAPAAQAASPGMLLQPQRWDLSLGELTHPVPAESLMPMFDAMVDRAFSRASNSVPEPNRQKEAAGSSKTETHSDSQKDRSVVVPAALAAAANRSS